MKFLHVASLLIYFGVADASISKQPIRGYWRPVASAPEPEFAVIASATTAVGRSASSSQQEDWQEAISAGFELEVGAAASGTMTSSVASSLALTSSEEITETCFGQSISETGQWVIYQWVMEQEADGNGVGFTMKKLPGLSLYSKPGPAAAMCPWVLCRHLLPGKH